MDSICPNSSISSGVTLVFKMLPYLMQDFLYGGGTPYIMYVSDFDIIATCKYLSLFVIDNLFVYSIEKRNRITQKLKQKLKKLKQKYFLIDDHYTTLGRIF